MSALYGKQSVSEEAARGMLRAAAGKAAELGVPVSVTVVDESGVLKAFHRADGAPLASVEFSQVKAKTAAGFGMETTMWRDMVGKDLSLGVGMAAAFREIGLIGGGIPLVADGQVVGAIGVSGALEDQDVAVAKAGSDAFEGV